MRKFVFHKDRKIQDCVCALHITEWDKALIWGPDCHHKVNVAEAPEVWAITFALALK